MVCVCRGHTFGKVIEDGDVHGTSLPVQPEEWLAVRDSYLRLISQQTRFDPKTKHDAAEAWLPPGVGNANSRRISRENVKDSHWNLSLANYDFQINGSLQNSSPISDHLGSRPPDAFGGNHMTGVLRKCLPERSDGFVLWILLREPNRNLKHYSLILLRCDDNSTPEKEMADEPSVCCGYAYPKPLRCHIGRYGSKGICGG
jgi:hypothetical protein